MYMDCEMCKEKIGAVSRFQYAVLDLVRSVQERSLQTARDMV